MNGTGVRKGVRAADLTGLSQAERISVLRARMNTLEAPTPAAGPGGYRGPCSAGPALARRRIGPAFRHPDF